VNEKDETELNEWLEESIGVAATVKAKLKLAGLDGDIAVENTLLDKGIRPYYFYTKEKTDGGSQAKSSQTGPATQGGGRVSVSDGSDRTFGYKAQLKADGLRWDPTKTAWTGSGSVSDFAARYPKLKVEQIA